MKLAAFDLEIAKILPEGDFDWQAQRPLGISCACLLGSDNSLVTFPSKKIDDYTGVFDEVVAFDDWSTIRLDEPSLRELVSILRSYTDQGFIIVTVNGLGFDFQILAEESGMWRECADLALNHHCDLMLASVCAKGWRTGLDSFAKGAGIKSKLKEVILNDGTVLQGMDGAKAPELWAAGEYDAVLAYLKQDVVVTLEAARTAVERGELRWLSSTSRLWGVALPGRVLPTCAEMLKWPRPDTSWMTDPPDPMEIGAWALKALKR